MTEVGRWLAEHPRGLLALAAAGWGFCYSVACWWFPFGRCWCCKGKGIHLSGNGKHFRDCKWICKGTGRRRRTGRTVFEAVRRIVKNAT